jgi:1,4-dihydroxy-2-naphthoate octaprenyltransferase
VGTTSSTEGERKKVISKSKISSRVFLLFLRILLSGLLLLFFFLSLSYVTCRMLVGFVYCLPGDPQVYYRVLV